MITIKIGGSVVDNLHPSTILDIKKVAESEGVILVHGGGKEVTKVCEQLGKEPKFVFDDRTAQGRNQRIAIEISEVDIVVTGAIANEALIGVIVGQRSVPVVRTGLGDGIDVGAGETSVTDIKWRDSYNNLLNGVDRNR